MLNKEVRKGDRVAKNIIVKSVSNNDETSIEHLSKHFGSNMGFHTGGKRNLICPCVKANVPFKVLRPLECSLSPEGNKMGILEPGIYQIIFNYIETPTHSVYLKRLDKKETEKFNIFIGWENDRIIDWKAIVPVKKLEL